ncbi:MAG TPA: serine/threonine-protein kinase [Gemmataceae bacterium]|jgi:serine/threonine protein kinase
MYARLRDCLVGRGVLKPGQFDRLLGWWQSERTDREELPAFLVRQGMLSPDGGMTLTKALRGEIPIDVAAVLLSPAALATRGESAEGSTLPQRAGTHLAEWRRRLGLNDAADPPAAAPAPAAGTPFGPYRLLEGLGRGPRATVFRADDGRTGNTVAVKVFTRPPGPEGATALEFFLEEARTAARISHPNCLPVLDSGREQGTAYLAMPLARGGSAQDALRLRGPMPHAQAARVGRLAAQGLAAAHVAGVAHGNLKPSNILLGEAGEVWLSDFGPQPPSGVAAPADLAADLRAFGVTLYRLLTNQPPPITPTGRVTKSAFDSTLPEPFRDLLDALLSDEPETKVRTANELAGALARAEGAVTAAGTVDLRVAGNRPPVPPPVPIAPPPPPGNESPGGPAVPIGLPHVGDTLGKCRLTGIIGQGSSGTVFRAEHTSLKIDVAVKVLYAEAEDPEVRRMLRREARLLARLNHPHVVRLWDFDDASRFPYLVMEYVEGPTLAEMITRSGRLPVHRTVDILRQIVDGLAAAQKLGIVHRDVKPANILIDPEGQAKLADLGLAVMTTGRVSTLARPRTAGMAGTVAYMSPEQAVASPTIDHRADVYSLGATFYHAVVGRVPFSGLTPMEMLLKHAKEMPPPPHTVAPDLPQAVSTVILQMMAKDPLDRHQTYDELLADLRYLKDVIGPPPARTEPVIELPPGFGEAPPSTVPTAAGGPLRAGWWARLRAWLGGE